MKKLNKPIAKNVSWRISPDFLGAIIGHQHEWERKGIRSDHDDSSDQQHVYKQINLMIDMFRIEENISFTFLRCFSSDW